MSHGKEMKQKKKKQKPQAQLTKFNGGENGSLKLL